MAHELVRFDSLSAFVDHVEGLPCNGGRPHENHKGWATSYPDTMRFAREGWAEGAKLAAQVAERVANRIVGSHVEWQDAIVPDVAGCAYDPGALVAGVPEAWVRIEPVGLKREVRIVFNASLSGVIDQSVMVARGVAVAALAMVLQAKGHPVTVDVGAHGMFGNRRRSVWIRLADARAGSPLDIDRLVYASGCSGFFRLLIHYYFAGSRDCFGSHMPTDPADPHEELGCDVYLGAAGYHDEERWADGGEAWILEQYNKQTEVTL